MRRADYKDWLSRREIARQFGISKDSVGKMSVFSEPPAYRRTVPIHSLKMDAFVDKID